MRSARHIINSLKERLGKQTDRELAIMLGLSPNTLATWIKRDAIDWAYLFKVLVDIDLNWLVRGVATEDMVPYQPRTSDGCAEIEREAVELRAQVAVLKDVIAQISQGKGPASITLTPSKEPVKSS